MRSKKTINTAIAANLEMLSTESQALYFRLLLGSNDAGIISLDNGHDPYQLFDLIQKGLIVVTKDNIILQGYITSNYGSKLKENYNPHRQILQIIKKSGYEYNPESNEIEVHENRKITDLGSLIKLKQWSNGNNTNQKPETSSEVIKTGRSKILDSIGSIEFALWLSVLLLISQSFHTAFTLMSLSHLPEPYNTIAGILTALIMDFQIAYFVIAGRTNQSLVFFIFCSLMNVYSLHAQTEYLSYNSFFAIVVSFAIPYAVHSVSGMVSFNKITDQ